MTLRRSNFSSDAEFEEYERAALALAKRRHTAHIERTASILDAALGPQAPLPDLNPKTRFGLGKPAMSVVPPAALLPLMAAMRNGATKYGAFNWRKDAVSATVYYDALLRHAFSYFDGENLASDSAVHHLGHIMACCAILLDAMSVGKLNDDRPSQGAFADLCAAMTKPLTNP